MTRIQPRKPRVYQDTVELGKELEPAKTSLEDAVDVMRGCVGKLQATGGFDIDEIEQAINPLVASVMRNKSAMAALLRMRALDDYTFSHAISNAVWGADPGAAAGFSAAGHRCHCAACSLLDIGKVHLPPELLVQPSAPTPEQWEVLKGHVGEGMKLLEENEVKNTKVLLAVQSHHERFDGRLSGRPGGNRDSALGPAGGGGRQLRRDDQRAPLRGSKVELRCRAGAAEAIRRALSARDR